MNDTTGTKQTQKIQRLILLDFCMLVMITLQTFLVERVKS